MSIGPRNLIVVAQLRLDTAPGNVQTVGEQALGQITGALVNLAAPAEVSFSAEVDENRQLVIEGRGSYLLYVQAQLLVGQVTTQADAQRSVEMAMAAIDAALASVTGASVWAEQENGEYVFAEPA